MGIKSLRIITVGWYHQLSRHFHIFWSIRSEVFKLSKREVLFNWSRQSDGVPLLQGHKMLVGRVPNLLVWVFVRHILESVPQESYATPFLVQERCLLRKVE